MAMREVVMIICDHCLHESHGAVEVEAVESIKVRFGREQPRTVDLCEDHAASWGLLRIIARSRGTVALRAVS